MRNQCWLIEAKIAPERHRRNKTRQATYNCPGWEGRTFLSQPNPVTTFPPTHCARLFRSGIGYTLWGTWAEWRNLIIIQNPDRFIQTFKLVKPLSLHHHIPISMVTWLVRDQSFLSRMLYIQKYPLAVFNQVYAQHHYWGPYIYDIVMTIDNVSENLWAKP